MDKNLLQLSSDEMRSIGYQAVDMLVEHFDTLSEKSVTRSATRAETEPILNEPLPINGTEAEAILSQLRQDVFTTTMHVDSPRFFAFVPSPSNFISVMGDLLAAGHNLFAGTWIESASAAQIELTTLNWLRQVCGLPEGADGLFVSGGSMANITGLAVARHVRLGGPDPKAIVYCSEQTHSSVERGLQVLGFYPEQLRKISTNAQFQMDIDTLIQQLHTDLADGYRPFCVVANAGATNTGAIDPLPELADLCEQQDLWLHVDGAYGAATVFCERGKRLLQGLERAHSVSLDPHKWLFQTIEMGCLLVRDKEWLADTFRILPEYLADTETGPQEVNFCDRGIQLTRNFRALKLWMSFKYFGLTAFQSAVNRGFELAELVERQLAEKANWEIYTPAQMAVITFRYAPPELQPEEWNTFNRQLVEAIIEGGFAMIATTVLRGQTVLRMCTINPRTSDEDIHRTVDWLDDLARKQMARQGNGNKDFQPI